MDTTKLACIFLIASAFALAGLLLVQIDRNAADNTAMADQVIAQPQFSLMTARTSDNNESLFVLDNNQAVLIVYKPNFGRDSLEPVTVIQMRDIFN